MWLRLPLLFGISFLFCNTFHGTATAINEKYENSDEQIESQEALKAVDDHMQENEKKDLVDNNVSLPSVRYTGEPLKAEDAHSRSGVHDQDFLQLLKDNHMMTFYRNLPTSCYMTANEDSDCSTSMTFSRCDTNNLIKVLFIDLLEVPDKFIDLKKYSNNFIQPNKSEVSKITFSQCKTDEHKLFQAEKLITVEIKPKKDISPVEWLVIPTDPATRFYFYIIYDHLNKPVPENYLGFKATFPMNIGGKKLELNANKLINDTSVNIYLDKVNIKITDFLTLLKQDVTALCPTNDFDCDPMKLGDIIVKSPTYSHFKGFEISLSGDGLWDAYISGKAYTESPTVFKSASIFCVYCKNGETDFSKTHCAVLSKFLKGNFKWQDVTKVVATDGSLGGVSKGMLHDVVNAKEIFFQLSKTGFEAPNIDVIESDFGGYALVSGSNNEEVFRADYSTPAACIRVTVDDIPTKYPRKYFENISQAPKIETFLIEACFSQDEISIHLPFVVPTNTSKIDEFTYQSLPYLSSGSIKTATKFIPPKTPVKIESFSVERRDRELKFCYEFSFYPSFEMMEELPGNVTLRNITIKECKGEKTNPTMTGSGHEKILDALSDVTAFTTKEKRSGVEGYLNIFQSSIIRERTGASYLSPFYKRTFKNMENFTIQELKFKKYFEEKQQLFLTGMTEMDDLSDATFEIIEYVSTIKKPMLKLCINAMDVRFSEIVAFIYNAPILDQNTWLRFSEYSMICSQPDDSIKFDTESCREANDKYSSTFLKNTKKGFKEGIIVYAKNLNLATCEVNGARNAACYFMSKHFDTTVLEAEFYGIAYPEDEQKNKFFAMEGYSKREMVLGEGLTIGPLAYPPTEQIIKELELDPSIASIKLKTRQFKRIANELAEKMKDNESKVFDDYMYFGRNDKLVITSDMVYNEKQEKKNEEEDITVKTSIRGTLKVKSLRCAFRAEVKLTGEQVFLCIQPDGSCEDPLRIPYVKSVTVKSPCYSLSLDKPIDRIEFTSRLLIGSAGEKDRIVMYGRENVAQYVHGTDLRKNKFYACASGDKDVTDDIDGARKLKLTKFFKAFGIKYEIPLFKNSSIRKACFTYHSGAEDRIWEIPERGINATTGLHLYGEIQTKHGTNHSIDAYIKGDLVALSVNLTQLRWGEKRIERVFQGGEKQTVIVSRAEMTRPILRLNFNKNGFHSGQISGYLKTLGYEGESDIFIIKDKLQRSTCLNYIFQYEGDIFDNIKGRLKLSSTCHKGEVEDLSFTVNIDVFNNISEYIPTIIEKPVNEFTRYYSNMSESLIKTIHNYTLYEMKFNEFLSEYNAEVANALHVVQQAKIERARAIQGASKKCSQECKPINMPGLKWQAECSKLPNGRVAGCMKFMKKRAIVSDVGCLSKCEAERVLSHVESMKSDAKARTKIEEYSSKVRCVDLADNLKSELLKTELGILRKLQKAITKNGRFMNVLVDLVNRRNKKFIGLNKLDSEFPLEAATKPNCVMFDGAGRIRHGELHKDISFKEELCFDGKFAINVIELMLNKAFKEEVYELNKNLNDASKSQAIMAMEFETKIEPKIKPVEECLAATSEAIELKGVQKRKYLLGAELSPLETSHFHVFSDKTILLFNKHSAWTVLKKSDPFKEISSHSIIRSDMTPRKEESACSATKRSIENYQQVLHYMKQWVASHKEGKIMLHETQDIISKGLFLARSDIRKAAHGISAAPMDIRHMNHWNNVTEHGMKKWLVESRKQLKHLNKEGMTLMKNQLKSMYTDDDHKSIQEFFINIADAGNKAFKRANIATESEDVFSHLSNDFTTLMEQNVLLEELEPILNKIDNKIVKAEKRSITCSA